MGCGTRANGPRAIHVADSHDPGAAREPGLGALLTAKQRERAAIVYAFTKDVGRDGTHGVNDGNSALTLADFARLGITGLRNREQVADYRKAWQSAIDDGQAQARSGGQETRYGPRSR